MEKIDTCRTISLNTLEVVRSIVQKYVEKSLRVQVNNKIEASWNADSIFMNVEFKNQKNFRIY